MDKRSTLLHACAQDPTVKSLLTSLGLILSVEILIGQVMKTFM